MHADRILLAHGSGGTMMKELIDEVFVEGFSEEALKRLDDAASLPFPGSRIAMSTDTYVVHPLFFPGGDIGRLAVCGTVNDVATSGANAALPERRLRPRRGLSDRRPQAHPRLDARSRARGRRAHRHR